MRNQSTSAIVLDIKDRAIAGHKRVEIRNAKREAADRAPFDLDVDRWLRRSLQTFVDDHVEDGNDQSIAEVVLAPDRCHRRDTSDDDLFGSSSAIRYGDNLLSRRDCWYRCDTQNSGHRSAKAGLDLTWRHSGGMVNFNAGRAG